MPTILDGKIARDSYKKTLIEKVSLLACIPKLALIQVGTNAESSIYIEQKKKFALSIGTAIEHIQFAETDDENRIMEKIAFLNNEKSVHGIIVQLPLPHTFDALRLINAISPLKDVDGLTDENQRLLAEKHPRFVPATAKGVSLL